MEKILIPVSFQSESTTFLAIFRSSIPWPPLLSDFYRFFAIFNFNIDIATRSALLEVPYSFKFFGTQIMPLIALVLCILVFLYALWDLCDLS